MCGASANKLRPHPYPICWPSSTYKKILITTEQNLKTTCQWSKRPKTEQKPKCILFASLDIITIGILTNITSFTWAMKSIMTHGIPYGPYVLQNYPFGFAISFGCDVVSLPLQNVPLVVRDVIKKDNNFIVIVLGLLIH